MIKLASGIVAVVSLAAALIILWLSPTFPEALSHHLTDWAAMWFALFRNPAAAAILLTLATLFLIAAMCLSDILVGLLFSFLAALFAFLCLLGALGSQFPAVAQSLERLLH